MADILPFPHRASKLAYLPEPDYFEAVFAEAMVLEAAHKLDPEDDDIFFRLLTARHLLEALLAEEPDAMPTEQPKMPFDSHARALNHGANRGLPLQAGEIAEFPHRSSFEAIAERVLIVACVVGACGVAGILAAIAIRSLI